MSAVTGWDDREQHTLARHVVLVSIAGSVEKKVDVCRDVGLFGDGWVGGVW